VTNKVYVKHLANQTEVP